MDTVDQTLSAEQNPSEQHDHPLSLVETVTLMLTEAGVENPEAWQVGLEPEALTSSDLNVQRFLINRRWRGLLIEGLTNEQILLTRNARGCLVDGRWELTDWIFHFKKDVIPSAIRAGALKVKAHEPETPQAAD
jgi:hypothetical protein